LACALGIGGFVVHLVFYHQPWRWVSGRGFLRPSLVTQLRLSIGWLALLVGLAAVAYVLARPGFRGGEVDPRVAKRLWAFVMAAALGLSLIDHDSWYVVGVVGLIALGDVAVRRRKKAAAVVLGIVLLAVTVISLLALAALVAFGCAYQGSCGWSAGEILQFWAFPAALAALLIFDGTYLITANWRRYRLHRISPAVPPPASDMCIGPVDILNTWSRVGG
jgi:hypothetical protein